MFDIGFTELLLIATVALLVLGPERLPGAARTVGALLRRARASFDSVKAEIEREVRSEEIKRSMADIPRPSDVIHSLTDPLEREARSISESVQSASTPTTPRDGDEPTQR